MANTQPFSNPIGIGKSTAQALGLYAVDHRRGQGAVGQPMYGNTFGTLSGVCPGGTSGSGVPNDLQVFDGGGLVSTMNAGHYMCDRGTGSLYLGMAYAGVSETHDPAHATYPRIDRVVIRNRDPDIDANVTETARRIIIKGTPSSAPTKPALTNGDVPLAALTINAGTAGFANIEDERLWVVARGGVYPRPSWDNRPGAYEGQLRDNLETNSLERWSGSAWEPIASPAAWKTFTPGLWSDAGACNLGSGAGVRAEGAYQLIGKNLKVRYLFVAVRPCNLGYGTIYTRLPNGLYSANGVADFHGRCQLNTGSPLLKWIGDAELYSNDNKVYPTFNLTRTDNVMGRYRAAASQGQPGNGIPQLANDYPDPLGGLGINIELEVQ